MYLYLTEKQFLIFFQAIKKPATLCSGPKILIKTGLISSCQLYFEANVYIAVVAVIA